ncbi:MAG TPA: hypothetical protein VG753_02720 [Candidatus Paceibacterota bacterium]|nr:hypothetical protein [Candidatus Paceibacterota bacterium]
MFWKSLIFAGLLLLLLAFVHAIPAYFAVAGVVLIVAGLYVRARDRDWAQFNQRQIDRMFRREPRFAFMPPAQELRRTWNPAGAHVRRARRLHAPRELLQMP